MKTITLQIGNSDDKLTQKEWAEYVYAVQSLLDMSGVVQIHFSGGSSNWERWQNFCWVFVCDVPYILKAAISKIGKQYKQDSVAWTEGETEFI